MTYTNIYKEKFIRMNNVNTQEFFRIYELMSPNISDNLNEAKTKWDTTIGKNLISEQTSQEEIEANHITKMIYDASVNMTGTDTSNLLKAIKMIKNKNVLLRINFLVSKGLFGRKFNSLQELLDDELGVLDAKVKSDIVSHMFSIDAMSGGSITSEKLETNLNQEYKTLKQDVLKSQEDTHSYLGWLEIATGVAGMLPTPLAPVFLGISAAAGLADAALYYNEGDNYMAGMMAALAIIPGAELGKIFKGNKVLTKRGIKGTQELIKKYKSGGKLTKSQLADLKSLGYSMNKNSGLMAKLSKSAAIQTAKNVIKSKTPKFLLNFLIRLSKLGFNLSKIVFMVGGTAYTFDKLYLFTFRDNQQNLDSRTRNDLRMFVNELLGYEKEVNEYILLKTTEALEEKMAQSGDSILKILPTTTEELDRMYLQTIDNDNTKKNKESVSPSINDVLSGKMDTGTQKKYTINYGQKGESVKEVQKMLDTLGYDLTNYGTVQNWNDGIFGEGTKMAVQYFQEDNGLTVNGIVDSNTLKKLTDIYNKNINNG